MFEIQNIIDILRSAKRHGSEKDEPEGNRYVLFSDTLLNKIILSLEKHLEELEDSRIEAMGEDA